MSRLRNSISAIVEALVGRKLLYRGLYPCTVAGQDASGALDLIPDDEEIRVLGTQHIKIRHGLPGFTVTVPEGARVMMGFEEGDPSKPYALLWDEDPGDVDEIVYDTGTQPVARQLDTVMNGELIWSTSMNQPYWRLLPATPWIPIVTSGTPGGPGPGEAGTPITGLISSGNTKFLA